LSGCGTAAWGNSPPTPNLTDNSSDFSFFQKDLFPPIVGLVGSFVRSVGYFRFFYILCMEDDANFPHQSLNDGLNFLY
jgi:hypothetical protein